MAYTQRRYDYAGRPLTDQQAAELDAKRASGQTSQDMPEGTKDERYAKTEKALQEKLGLDVEDVIGGYVQDEDPSLYAMQKYAAGAGEYDFSRINKDDPNSRLTPRQAADLYVYQSSPVEWRQPDGRMTTSYRQRYLDFDRNVQGILSFMPELANTPNELYMLASEPYLSDRLVGMQRAQDWLQMRQQAAHQQILPVEHQQVAWDHMTTAEQTALRDGGYRPPSETGALNDKPQALTETMFGVTPSGWGKVGTFGEYVNADFVFDVLGNAQKFFQTGYRLGYSQLETGDFGPNLANPKNWGWWADSWRHAWDGERNFSVESQNRAWEIADGNVDRFALYRRMASGDSIDEIAALYADVGTPEYAQAYLDLKEFARSDVTRRALRELQQGKLSPGRQFATDVLRLDSEDAMFTPVSGIIDAAWTFGSDPVIIGGALFKGMERGSRALALVKGLNESREGYQARQLAHYARMVNNISGEDFDAAVLAQRGALYVNPVTHEGGVNGYYKALDRLDIPGQQKRMLELNDFANAARLGDMEALSYYNHATPQGKKLLNAYKKYLGYTQRMNPDGTPQKILAPSHAQEWMSTTLKDIDPSIISTADDAGDFISDLSGVWAMQAGYWNSSRWEHAMVPKLTKLGSYRIRAKLKLTEKLDHLANGDYVPLREGQRFLADDFEDADQEVRKIAEGLAQAGSQTIEDHAIQVRNLLIAKGHDAATVERQINRAMVRRFGITMEPGELPNEAIMRTLFSTEDDMMHDYLRRAWGRYLGTALGDPDAGLAQVDEMIDVYGKALGVSGDTRLMAPNFDLQDALEEMAKAAPGSKRYAAARKRYAKAITQGERKAGLQTIDVDEALTNLDILADQRYQAIADLPAAMPGAAEDVSNRLRGYSLFPITPLARGSARFILSLLEHVPKTGYLMLDDASTPERLEQLLAMNIRGARARQLYGEFMAAGEGQRRQVLRSIYAEMFHRAGILNDSRFEDFVDSWMSASLQRYGVIDEFQSPMGLAHVGFLSDAHHAKAVAIPSFREIHANMKRGRILDMLWGYDNRFIGVNSAAASRLMNAWKASVVLRPAMIPRAGGEELFSHIMRHGWGYALDTVAGHMLDAKKVVAGRNGVSDVLYADAIASMGLDRKYGSPIKALGHKILDTTRAALPAVNFTPEEQHALRMLALSPAARKAFAEVSGVNAGYAPFAQITRDLESAADLYLDIIDAKTGLPAFFNLRGAGKWRVVDEKDAFFADWNSLQWATYASDELSRAAVYRLSHVMLDDAKVRIGATLGSVTGSQLLNEEQLLDSFIVGIGRWSPDTRRKVLAWLDQNPGALDPRNAETIQTARTLKRESRDARLLKEAMGEDLPEPEWKDLNRYVSNKDLQPLRIAMRLPSDDGRSATELFEDIARELSWQDLNNAFNVSRTSANTVPAGYYDAFLGKGEFAYRGTHMSFPGNDVFFAPGTTFEDITPHVGPWGYSGPGLYATDNGFYAERYVHGGQQYDPMVTKLRPRSGTMPQVIDLYDSTEAPAMVDAMKGAAADVFLRGWPSANPIEKGIVYDLFDRHPSAAEAARIIADVEHNTSTPLDSRMLQQLIDVFTYTSDPSRSSMVGSAGHYGSFNVHSVMDQGQSNLNTIVSLFKLDDDQAAEVILQAWNEHVVKPFTARGFRGVADHQPQFQIPGEDYFLPSDAVGTAVYWHPGDFEVVEEIPFRDSAAAIYMEKAAYRRERWADVDYTPDEMRELAIQDVMRILMRPERQYKLHRMDLTAAGVSQMPAPGHVRALVPIVPDSVMSEMASHTNLFANEQLVYAPLAGYDQTAHTLMMSQATRKSTPQMDRFAQELMQKLEDPNVPKLGYSSRLAFTDPDQAQEFIGDLRAMLRKQGLDESVAADVHLGFIDMPRPTWNALAPVGGTMTPEGAVETKRALLDMPYAGQAAAYESRLNKGFSDVPAIENNLLSAGQDRTRWIDNQDVLDNATSLPVDRFRKMNVNLTNQQRAELLQVLGKADLSVVPTDDWNLIVQARAYVLPGRPAESELVKISPETRALIDPTLADLNTMDVFAPGSTTQWTLVPGDTLLDRVRMQAERVVDNTLHQFTGHDGRWMHSVGRPVADGEWNQALHMTGRDIGALPSSTIGQYLVNPSARQEGALSWLGGGAVDLANKGMEKIGQGISWLSRHPEFRRQFASSYVDASNVMRSFMVDAKVQRRAGEIIHGTLDDASDELMELTAMWQDLNRGARLDDVDVLHYLHEQGFLEGAPVKSWVADPDTGELLLQYDELARPFTQDEKMVLRWWRQDEVARNEALKAAQARAVDATIPYIDDHHVRSQFSEKIRNVVPFWFAEEAFYKRWVRTFVHSPEALRRMTLSHRAFQNMGWLTTNEYGEEVYEYPGADLIAPAFATLRQLMPGGSEWTMPLQVGFQGQLRYAAPGFDRIGLPSAGPLVAIPLRLMRVVNPTLSMDIEDKLMGQRGVGKSIPEALVPSIVYRGYKFFTASDEDLTRFTMGAMMMMQANHPEDTPADDATAEEVEAYYERLSNYSRILLATQWMMGTTAPSSPSPQFDPSMLSQEFQGYLNAGVPIDLAVADFLKDHPEATPYTLFASSSRSGAPTDPTEETYQAIVDNGDFYNNNLAAAYFLPQGEPEAPFDRRAWYELFAHKIRTRKGVDDFYRDLKFSEAADEYFKRSAEVQDALDAAEATVDRNYIRQWWSDWKRDYFARHRIFAEDLTSNESQNKRKAVIANMRELLADPENDPVPDLPQTPIIRQLTYYYDEAENQIAATKGDQSTRADNFRAEVRKNYVEWGMAYSRRHPTASIYFQRILLPEIDPSRKYASGVDTGEEDAA